LAALTKLCRKFTGAVAWPIEYREIGRTYSYRMEPAIAISWNELPSPTPFSMLTQPLAILEACSPRSHAATRRNTTDHAASTGG